MLQLERVSLSYGSFRALDNINLHAGAGELVLLGANGAGKSSIFLALSGIHRTSGGSMRFDGRELGGMKPSQIVQAGLMHCPEGRKLFPAMSVEKNLALGAAYVHRGDRAGSQRTLEEVYQMFPILREKRHQAAGSLSGGQQQMVALGRALMAAARALLLDEPSLGLAPLVVKQMFEVIQRINRAGTTVLLAEQNAYAALGIAHRAYVIEGGRIVMEGDRDTLLKDEGIRKAYIGG